MDIDAIKLTGKIYFESKFDNIFDNNTEFNNIIEKLKHIDITGNIHIDDVSSSWKVKNGWQVISNIELAIMPLIEFEDYYKLNYDYPVINPNYHINTGTINNFLTKFLLIHFTTNNVVPFYIENFIMDIDGQETTIEDAYLFGEDLDKREFTLLINYLRSEEFLKYANEVFNENETKWKKLDNIIQKYSINLAKFSKRKTGTSVIGDDRSIFVFN